MQLLLIGGRSGAGKTTVASEVFHILASLDVRHAWIEGDFLDLAHPAPWQQGLRLAEENLQAVWRNYARAGYDRLIYSNSAAVLPNVSAALAANLGKPEATVAVWLRARDETVGQRLGVRESGEVLAAHLQRSALMASRLDAEVAEDVVRLDTDGRTAENVAHEVVRLLAWS